MQLGTLQSALYLSMLASGDATRRFVRDGTFLHGPHRPAVYNPSKCCHEMLTFLITTVFLLLPEPAFITTAPSQ